MNYKSLRTQKELINMRENARVDWRAELNEEHPYVEVMPQKGGKKDKAKMAKKAVETTKEVREGTEVISEISDKRVNNMLKKRDKQVDKALDDNRRIGQSRNQWLSGVSDKMKKSDRAQEAAMRRKQRLAMKEENVAEQMGGQQEKLGPREKGRKEKGKKRPQAIRASRARLAALKKKLGVDQ